MTAMEASPVVELTEDGLEAAAPRVRAETVRRLERLYELAQTQIHLFEESGRAVDPRWAEISLRILRTEAEVFRLNRAGTEPVVELPPSVNVKEIEAQLDELARKSADVPSS